MNADERRLIDAIADSLGRIVARYDVPRSDTDQMAVDTALGELFRQVEFTQVKSLYAAGYRLAVRLTEWSRGAGADLPDISAFAELPDSMEAWTDFNLSQDRLATLKTILSSLVRSAGSPSGPGELQDITAAILDWEGALLKIPGSGWGKKAGERDEKAMLESSARKQGGDLAGSKVVEFTRLIGGFANYTTLFKLADGQGKLWDLVARAETGLPLGIDGRDIAGEYHLLRYLHKNGAKVAEPIWLERDKEEYGAQFLVTRKVDGKNFGTVVHAAEINAVQLRGLATQLAKIHALPLDQGDTDLRQSHLDTDLIGGSTSRAINAYLDRWIRLWRSTGLENSPSIEATMHWLRANMPQIAEPPVLVHGDFALHNVMMQGDEISGVLDWEMSHLGDRAEDIAGLLASFSNNDDAEDFMQFYLEAGGRPVSDFRLKYSNVFRYFMMYVVMLESQFRFYSLPETHPGLLVLGSFVQTPSERMAHAIDEAEKAKALDKAKG